MILSHLNEFHPFAKVQSGFTNFGPNFQGEALQASSFQITGQGLNDLGNVTQRSFDGWYWGILPAFTVGVLIRWIAAGAIHVSDRSKQAKKPLLHTLKEKKTGYLILVFYYLVLIGLFSAIFFLVIREASTIE
jgi:hypothetical protein